MMNTELKLLYEKYWGKLGTELDQYISRGTGDLPTNPLLINISDEKEYLDSDIRIMIFGQETNDWGGIWGNKNINELINDYEKFFLSNYCFRYGGHFWNAILNYKKFISEKYPNKKVSILWNNLLKIGKASNKGTPSLPLIKIQKDLFPVIKSEIEILSPNIIIFFSGPDYDKYLNMEFSDLKIYEIPGWDTRKLARISSCNLPYKSFRTYHPNYLWRNKFYDYRDSIFSQIESDISKIK